MHTAVKYGCVGFAVAAGILLLVALFKNGKPLRTLFWSGTAGVICLAFVCFFGKYAGTAVAFNGYSLGISFFGGVPGVIGLVVASSLLGM